jgi:hypothetical protein
MDLAEIVAHEVQEALGAVNKWYCSKYYGYDVTDPDTLVAYYIKNGGAQHYRESLVAIVPAACCSSPG